MYKALKYKYTKSVGFLPCCFQLTNNLIHIPFFWIPAIREFILMVNQLRKIHNILVLHQTSSNGHFNHFINVYYTLINYFSKFLDQEMHKVFIKRQILNKSLKMFYFPINKKSDNDSILWAKPFRKISLQGLIWINASKSRNQSTFIQQKQKLSLGKTKYSLQNHFFFNFCSAAKYQHGKSKNLESASPQAEGISSSQTTNTFSTRLPFPAATELNINLKLQNQKKEAKENVSSKLINDSQFIELLLFAEKHLGIFGIALIIALGLFYFVVIRFGNQIWQKADQFYQQLKKIRQNNEIILDQAYQLIMKYDEWLCKSELYKQVIKETKQLLHFGINAQRFMEEHFKIRLIEASHQDSIFQVLLSMFFSLKNFPQLVRSGRIYILKNGINRMTSSKELNLDILREITVVTSQIENVVRSKKKKIRRLKFMLQVLQKLFGDENKDEVMNHMDNSSIPNYLAKYENEKIVLILDRFEQFYVLMQDPKKKDQLMNIFMRLRQLSNTGWVNIIAVGYNTTFINELIRQANTKEDQFRIGSYFIKKEVFQMHRKNFVEYDFIEKLVERYDKAKGQIDQQQMKRALRNIYETLKMPNSSAEILTLISQLEKQLNSFINKNDKKSASINILKSIGVKLHNFRLLSLKNKRSYIKSKVFIGNQEECEKKIILLMKIFMKEQLLFKWKDKELIIQNLREDERKVYEQLCKHQIIFYFDFFSKDYEDLFINMVQQNQFYQAVLKNYADKNQGKENLIKGNIYQLYKSYTKQQKQNSSFNNPQSGS